jgi:hypothetical protein
MFEVDRTYENRIGKYTVLAIEQRKMHVRYEDGTYADLNIDIQSRIWQNILSEQEAAKAKAVRSAQVMQRSGISTRYFIKSISLPAPEELLFPGWHEQVVMTFNPILATRIKMGDRLIYYAIETDHFFAVATITGDAFKADPKDYFYNVAGEEASFFPVDVDVASLTPDTGIPRNSVELEAYPDFQQALAQPENFFSISEDDFELLAELLTELNESEENDLDDEDDDYDDEDEE